MVATRRSLSTMDGQVDQQPPSDEDNIQFKKAMKKLQIDALPALRGETIKKEENAAVYHWRGSTYAVAQDTPQEWLDKEPTRYKKRKSTAPPESDEVQPAQTRKRARSPAAEVEAVEEEPAAKRPRRHTQNYTIDYKRPRTLSDFSPRKQRSLQPTGSPTPEKTARRTRPRPTREQMRREVPEVETAIAQARKQAKRLGFQVAPLPQHALAARQQARAKSTVELTVWLARMNSKVEKASQAYQQAKHEVERTLQLVQPAINTPAISSHDNEASRPDESLNQLTPASSTPKDINSSSTLDTPLLESTLSRRDSLTDIYHPDSPPTSDLPLQNKAGQTLRWSLPAKATADGRAEEAINKHRMPNESHGARRRRVKREMQLVRSWKEVDVDDDASEDVGGTVH
ncbi:hypothetical protein BDY17DRAFT_294388 [Neohortaea acidophila]|uniref:Uncharacterized protein n=1 Tax=Neohortaea acidophila TaxID=245834 RepID=A0A6A6Q0T7_9PEZI|nr:uncharacterized protein BDY17DRAFT_294388 [Neohortaea acidophila]KAF2485875.1 hypothetical protein BDY17DRAFT_294388 [Neohortaea acidophila]